MESERKVNSVLNALSILECFQVQDTLQLKQISEMTKLQKSRIIRLCGTLESKGYLSYDLEKKLYRLGSKLLFMGRLYEKHQRMPHIVESILKYLTRMTKETAVLNKIEGTERVLLAQIEGTLPLRYSSFIGERLPLHAGSFSKVFLAFGPEDLRRRILGRGPLERVAPCTIVDPKLLQKEVIKTRKQGYGFSSEERLPDAASMAVPVFDNEKKLCFVIGIAGLKSRFSHKKKAEFLPILLSAAKRFSRELGYNL